MFTPPFCPKPLCSNHLHPVRKDWWRHFGFHSTKTFGLVPRFQCCDCRGTFSIQTFSLDYFAKRRIDYRDLLHRHSSAMSLRSIGRGFHASCATIQNRLDRLCRQALALHAALRPLASPSEDVCTDGFVDFDVSQFFVSETTISITSGSLFFLDLSHANRRRSGTMTAAQKEKAASLYARAKFEKGGIRRTFRDILDSLERERPPRPRRPLVLITDEKKEYQGEFHRHPLFVNQDARHRFIHHTISSRAPRCFRNPLFASNYLDREIRKDQASHHRETVCFNRNVANGLSRLGLYLIGHNYLKKFRIKAPKTDDRVHAVVAGIESAKVKKGVAKMFEERSFLSRITLPPTLERIWEKTSPTPLSDRPSYLPMFALG